MTAKVETSLKKLASLSKTLNEVSDELSRQIGALESALNSYKLGIRAWFHDPIITETELTDWLARQRSRQDAVGSLPTRVRSFLKDVQALDTRRAKAMRQTILSAAHVYRDGRIELEFRGQQTS